MMYLTGLATIALAALIHDPVAARTEQRAPNPSQTPQRKLERGWREVTPLRPDGESRLSLTPADSDLVLRGLQLSETSLVCFGVETQGLSCEVHGCGDTPLVVPRGRAVTGRVLLGGTPVGGGAVSVIPEGIHTDLRYLMPLRVRADRVERDIATDQDGRFSVPPLGPGRYRLEVRVPNGRSQATEPFTVRPFDVSDARTREP